tara:strand:+ start:217 stop:453 length:237 start_codon:yes stop_codon:yes gene_type:complete
MIFLRILLLVLFFGSGVIGENMFVVEDLDAFEMVVQDLNFEDLDAFEMVIENFNPDVHDVSNIFDTMTHKSNKLNIKY